MAHVRIVVLTWSLELDTPEGRAIAREVVDEFVPMLSSQPGFISLQGFVAGDHERTSVTVTMWDSAEHAAAGTEAGLAWTREHVGQYVTSRTAYGGETLMSA